MTKQHQKPCRECPWRRKSAPGWLGEKGPPEYWLSLAHGECIVPCHLRTNHQCAGMSIYRRNVAKMCWTKGVLVLPKDLELVFGSRKEFQDHHEQFQPNENSEDPEDTYDYLRTKTSGG